MNDAIVDSFSKLGLPGLVIALLVSFIWALIKEHKSERIEHKAERQDWLVAYKDAMRLADDRQSETNTVLRELVVVVRELNSRSRRGD